MPRLKIILPEPIAHGVHQGYVHYSIGEEDRYEDFCRFLASTFRLPYTFSFLLNGCIVRQEHTLDLLRENDVITILRRGMELEDSSSIPHSPKTDSPHHSAATIDVEDVLQRINKVTDHLSRSILQSSSPHQSISPGPISALNAANRLNNALSHLESIANDATEEFRSLPYTIKKERETSPETRLSYASSEDDRPHKILKQVSSSQLVQGESYTVNGVYFANVRYPSAMIKIAGRGINEGKKRALQYLRLFEAIGHYKRWKRQRGRGEMGGNWGERRAIVFANDKYVISNVIKILPESAAIQFDIVEELANRHLETWRRLLKPGENWDTNVLSPLFEQLVFAETANSGDRSARETPYSSLSSPATSLDVSQIEDAAIPNSIYTSAQATAREFETLILFYQTNCRRLIPIASSAPNAIVVHCTKDDVAFLRV